MAYRWTMDDVLKVSGKRAHTTLPALPKAKKQAKYLNVKTTDLQGVTHDGKGEYERWCELQLLEKAGAISQLRRQVPYALVHNGILICRYIADFVYVEGAATIVEDKKSPRTRALEAFRMKVRLMQACHSIQVREV